ncbi:hypothetical protein CYMTET_13716 [Cymbomonas tetramitiformis]|uniref:VHS domain-containing protein n=1 Tax=Cymbomonas tetramitiformis TaxID=36881 RepID=A0AAE0LAX3_9CHLO|nr:hypothetical protein CYMTET_13716 [Cymbomonas tetramitiformis]
MATQQETAASVRHFRNLIQLSAEYPDRWEDVIHFCDSIREGDDAMTFSAVRALEASIESIDPRECAAGLRFLEITVKNFYDPKGKSVRANPLQDILVDLFTDVWIARFHQVAASHPHNESIRNFLRGCIREWVQSLPSSMRSSPSKSAMLELCEHLEQPVPAQPTASQSRMIQTLGVAQPVMTAPGGVQPEHGALVSTDAGPALPQQWAQQGLPPVPQPDQAPTRAPPVPQQWAQQGLPPVPQPNQAPPRAPPPLPNNAAATLGSPYPVDFLRAQPATPVPQGIPIPQSTAFPGGPGSIPAGHVATGLPVQPPGLGDEATAAAQAEAEARERAFAADLERALELSRTESRENQASAFTEDQALHAALEISRLEEAERVGGAAQLEAVLQVSQLEAEAQLEKNRQATLRDELQHAYALLTKSQEEKKRELRNIDEEMAVAAGGQGDWELITELSKQHSLLEEEAKAVGKCRELVLNTVTSLDSMKDLVARENASEAEVGLLEERALQALIAALTEHSQDTPTDSVGSAIYRELQEKFGERWDTPAEEKKLARKGSGAFGWLKSKLSDFSNKGKESPPSKPPAVGSASQGAVGNSAVRL